MRHVRPGRATSLVLAACLAACGGEATTPRAEQGAGAAGARHGEALPPLFEALRRAPLETAFRGTRQVTLHREGEVIAFVEVVGADGKGRFAVEVPEVHRVPPGLDAGVAALLLEQRGRFGYNVRDPHVTDLGLLAKNWRAEVEDDAVLVAGHACRRIQLARRRPLSRTDARYVLDVEPASGIVLAWQELDASGIVRSEAAYSTFELGADVSDMDLRARDFPVRELDPLADLSAQVGGRVLAPSLPPPGFALEAAELLSVPELGEWVKFAYTDGLERAFFLHRAGVEEVAGAPSADSVVHFPFGPWTFAMGSVRGVDVIAAGKVPARHLGELIQSALH